MRPFPASTELLKKNIWGKSCPLANFASSLAVGFALATVVRPNFHLRDTGDVRVFCRGSRREQLFADQTSAHPPLDFEHFSNAICGSGWVHKILDCRVPTSAFSVYGEVGKIVWK
jgi:hypothetical protein